MKAKAIPLSVDGRVVGSVSPEIVKALASARTINACHVPGKILNIFTRPKGKHTAQRFTIQEIAYSD